MNEPLNLSEISERDRLALYGALFAVAFSDKAINKEEVATIFALTNLEGMSTAAKQNVQSYIVEPPSLWGCLHMLKTARSELRYGFMINLVEVAWADGELSLTEGKAIGLAQQELKISQEQLDAIKNFVQKSREIRARGLDDSYATDAMKTAIAVLSSVGVPTAAIWLSGSVAGLSAAGITSGLAGLGFFGAIVGTGAMMTGIGVAALIGAGAFVGINKVLDTGGKSKKAKLKTEQDRKIQLVITNMQGAANQLVEEISSLKNKSFSIENAILRTNQKRIKLLTKRLTLLLELLGSAKQSFDRNIA